MSKVISMYTRQEITSSPFQKEAAEAIIDHVLKFNAGNAGQITISERIIIDFVVRYIRNASGTNAVHEVQEIETETETFDEGSWVQDEEI